jgi:ATP:ADP antiporter, AAA family
MTTTSSTEFGPIRSFLWPIHNRELPKFLPMGLMMFFILFNYTILRASKDTLVMSVGGASIIPFLKGYIVFPAAILFVVIYSKLLNLFSKEKVFYIILSFFMIFYIVFALFIYPNKEFFHPSVETVTSLKSSFPALQHFISIAGAWSYSLYYVLAELWGSAMLSLLFWQFANDITKTSEAKRFYGMFGLVANLALIFAGILGKVYYTLNKSLSVGTSDPYLYKMWMNISTVVVCCLATIFLYAWMQKNVVGNPKYVEVKTKTKSKKQKLTIKESFAMLFRSKYLGMIALLVICYGISMNLIELLWKAQLQAQFPDMNDRENFMQNLFIGTGAFTMFVILFSKGIVQKFGWFRGAIATPLIISITGAIFFAFMFFSGYVSGIATSLGMTTLLISLWVGTIQNIFSKGVKYGLFDPTKEMAYIPLDDNLKTRGKAAVDVLGARFGKAGGGYIASVLMMLFASGISDVAGFLAIFITAALCLWIWAVGSLNSLYKEKLAESSTES